MSNSLTPKQEKFSQKFVELGNASEAYRQAYDAENMSPEAIHEEAYRLTNNPDVALRIEHLQELSRKRHEVTVDRIIHEFARLAFLDIRKAFDEDGNMRPIHELDDDTAAAIAGLEIEKRFSSFGDDEGKPIVESRTHKIKFSDKKGALDSLARHLGMFIDKTEITGKDGTPLASPVTVTVTPDLIKTIVQQVRDEF